MAKFRMKKWVGWIVILSLLLLSFPVMPGGQAASLTDVKDTISDSDLGVDANHEIKFTVTNAVPEDGQIKITFDPAGLNFDLTGVLYTDIDLFIDNVERTLGDGAAAQTDTVDGVTIDTINDYILFDLATSTAYAIPANATGTVKIGTNAAGGVNQINNPSTAGSYRILIETKDAANALIDSAEAMVAITEDVVVTATVSATLTFTISGVTSGQSVNGTVTNIDTTATTIPFGTLTVGATSTAAQDLAVATNASDGFTVTIFQDQNLTNANGNDIDCFDDGVCVDYTSAAAWSAPAGILGQENTYGHFGITSEDESLGTNCASDYYGTDLWAGLSGTTQAEVMCHTGPADGSTPHKGATRVGFNIEITALQEAGDYTNTLTYIATPTY
jgi:hypothetical protein